MIAGSRTHSVGSHSPPHLGPEAYSYLDEHQVLTEKLETSFDLIQIVTLMTLKLAVLFFYRRIFQGRAFNIASWTLIGVAVAWAVTFFVAILAACRTHLYTNFESLGALKMKCVDTFVVLICLAVFDVIVDLAILIMPIPLVLALKMPMRRKVAVILTLMVGALAIACGITRMALFAEILGPQVLTQPTVGGLPADDLVGVVSVLMFWGMLEMGVGMVAICLPTLRPIFLGWSPETVLRNVRSALSLRSIGSSKRSRYSNDDSKGFRGKMESQTSLTKDIPPLYPDVHAHHEAYALGPINSANNAQHTRAGEVRVNRELTQSVDVV
ncbi:hypothetical protein EV356DRAFT_510579 [Viridothelium virens]|uniref:Rhodopsin domain-containing protein n=1 Tax=Viridothelium virens TaxID=1048519 RepID=A0A6A6HIH1_VIRVR|nr:hypothetical protein EV356DRAFT_510579 [Viridothelium virens]